MQDFLVFLGPAVDPNVAVRFVETSISHDHEPTMPLILLEHTISSMQAQTREDYHDPQTSTLRLRQKTFPSAPQASPHSIHLSIPGKGIHGSTAADCHTTILLKKLQSGSSVVAMSVLTLMPRAPCKRQFTSAKQAYTCFAKVLVTR